MSMRITGLATGMDIDQVIKDTMKPYRVKIQQVQQNKEITEIKQKLYREVITQSREFYNKYLDIAKSDSILKSSNWSTVKFTSADEGAVTVKGLSGAKADNYTVNVQQLAKSATVTLKTTDIVNGDKISVNGISVNTKVQKLDGDGNPIDGEFINKTNSEIVSELNSKFKENGLDITAINSDFAQGIVLRTNAMGSTASFSYNLTKEQAEPELPLVIKGGTETGSNAKVVITNGSGTTYIHESNSNSITLDGVQFTFNDTTVDRDPIRVTGKVDATNIKDKIVSFINDYNTLIEKLNTLISEKRDSSYMPLTSEQKEAMSEKEIELWETKVKTGQLSRDSDLTRIANQMKSATKSMFSGSLAFLEKAGINPVADYSGTKNGTFTIDEDKLTSALESNAEDVMKLFIASNPTDSSATGVFQRIKTILYNETMTTSARLLKKAGFEGTSTVANNELTKSIEQFDRKMKDMETIFSRREQQLYTKYASLETMMNNLNSQQSYLLSQLGMA